MTSTSASKISDNAELQAYCQQVAQRSRAASRALATLPGAAKIAWLQRSADMLRTQSDTLLSANQRDLDAAPGYGLTDAEIDRLRLTTQRIDQIARGLEEVAQLPEPIGRVIDSTVRPNGLVINKVRVPLGVVFFVYESRPNVTADAAAICVKAGDAVILRGGKEAFHSSQAIVAVLHEAARETGMPVDAVQLVETLDRAAVGCFLAMPEYIDVAIPRGGEGLIRRVTADARMPVIKHFDGNCHVYIDATADLERGCAILVNSKCQRMGVCNAAESLLVHQDVAEAFLRLAGPALASSGVVVRGDARVCKALPEAEPASEADFRTEFLGPMISAKVVTSLDEAIEHINAYGSHHTDAIVTEDVAAAARFLAEVDSAIVVHNASTQFA
ncbi:MAG: glutamate-5-semialdehyde dehydrogenase, partial [Planctomycetales bacterium]|nr:glutamate-5-semialdehyde dehydrogenase [Planctomycetales bacterium]